MDFATVKAKVEKYFGEIPPGPPVSHQRSWAAPMTGTHRAVLRDRVPQVRIYKVWNFPEFGSQDADYLDMTSDVLALGKTSRLYRRLVYDEQLVTDIAAYVNPREIGGQFMIQASVRNGVDPARAEKAIDEELAKLLASGPTAEEVSRVRTQYLANFARGVDRIGGFGGKSDVLAMSQAFLGDAGAYKTKLARERNATPALIQAAAKRWLSDGQYVLEVIPFGDLEASGKPADRNAPPAPGEPPQLRLPKLERTTLSNGLKVVLAERHEIPLVNFELMVDSGYSADQGVPGTAALTARLIDEGTRTRSSMEIGEQLAQLGATLNTRASMDSLFLRLSALKSNLDPSLAIFSEVALEPSFPQTDFAREQKQQLASIEREKTEPVSMGLRLLPALIYPKDHGYAEPWTGSGTPASVAKLTREDVVRFHQTWFKPNHSTLMITGDTTMAEIRPRLGETIRRVEARRDAAQEYLERGAARACHSVSGGSPRFGAVADSRRQRGAAEERPGRHFHRDHEQHPGRRFRFALEHEPARRTSTGPMASAPFCFRRAGSGRSWFMRRSKPERRWNRLPKSTRNCAAS